MKKITHENNHHNTILNDHYSRNKNSKSYYPGQPYSKSSLYKIAKRNLHILLEYDFDEAFIVKLFSTSSKNYEFNECLKYVKHQTEDICIAAIKKDVNNFNYVINRTEKIWLLAIKMDPIIFLRREDKSEEFCIKAISVNINVFKYIHNQTPKIIDAVFNSNGGSIVFAEFIHNIDEEIAFRIVKRNAYGIRYVRNLKEESIIKIVKEYPFTISHFFHQQTPAIILAAYSTISNTNEKGLSIFIENIVPGVMENTFYEEIVKKDGLLLKHIKQRTPQIELLAVQQNWQALAFVSNFTEEICVAAYDQNMRALCLLSNQFECDNPSIKNTSNLKRHTIAINSIDLLDSFLIEIEYADIHRINALHLERQMSLSLHLQKKIEASISNANSGDIEAKSISRKMARIL